MRPKAGPVELDRAISALSAGQHGVVSGRQLRQLGASYDQLKRRVQRGVLHRVHRGVYAVGRPVDTYLGRCTAAVLAAGPGVALSHRTAASLHHLLPQPSYVEITTTSKGATLTGVRVHRTRNLPPEQIARHHGIPLTTPARTLLDLGEVARSKQLERALSEAERRNLLDTQELNTLLSQAKGRRTSELAKLTATAAPTRSHLERKFLVLLRSHDFPAPKVNQVITTPTDAFEVDFVWPDHHLIVELDGQSYHADRRSFHEDRRRDAVLQAAGYRTIRITDRQLTRETARLLAALLSCR
jgi:very-short-patch-repair endonuclease